MKHRLPSVEQLIRTDCIIVDLTDPAAIRDALVTAGCTPVFVRVETGKYGLLPSSASIPYRISKIS